MGHKLKFLPNGELMTGEKLKGLEKVAGVGLRAPVVLRVFEVAGWDSGVHEGVEEEVERLDGEFEGDKPKVGGKDWETYKKDRKKVLDEWEDEVKKKCEVAEEKVVAHVEEIAKCLFPERF